MFQYLKKTLAFPVTMKYNLSAMTGIPTITIKDGYRSGLEQFSFVLVIANWPITSL